MAETRVYTEPELLVEIEALPSRGGTFELELSAETLRRIWGVDDRHSNWTLTPARATVHLQRAYGGLELQADVEIEYDVPCDRCVQPVHGEARESVALRFEPAPEADPVGGEHELSSAELEVGEYDGESFDVAWWVAEQVSLMLPEHPLCDAECRGLCAQCGQDLNQGSCDCKPPMDPRWAGLAELVDS